jgi:hypothetical protein
MSIVAAAVLAGCAGPIMVGYQGTFATTSLPPDDIYAAAVRVFLRKGWGFQSRDPNARAVETEWVNYERFVGKGMYQFAHRVIVTKGNVEIFTSCRINDSNLIMRPCPDGQRPYVVPTIELDLIRQITNETLLIAGQSAPPSGGLSQSLNKTEPDALGCVSTCGKDRQSCQAGCERSDRCKQGCNDGYQMCLKVCSKTK